MEATNPANYRLSRNGVDVGAFISGIVYGYNAAANRYDAAISFLTPITDGLFEFTLLSTITDASGNRIDGRADGSGFSRDFKLEFTLASVPSAGAELRANTTTTNQQRNAAIAADEDGDYVLIWDSQSQDGSAYGVYGQRYSAAGVPQGFEFRVNTFTTGDQFTPDVAMDANGDFVVIWRSYGQDGDNDGVYAQRFAANGVPQGGEFRVNTVTIDRQLSPSVAMNAAGDFVVAWTSYGQDGDSGGIRAKRYNAAGVAVGGEIAVNNVTNGSQRQSDVAIDGNGGFVVVWESPNVDGQVLGIAARRFSETGLPAGNQFQVNQFFQNDQGRPAVAMSAAGNFVVTWQSQRNIDSLEIDARIYGATGLPLTGELRVNTFTTGAQEQPDIAIDDSGDFIVSWVSQNQDGNEDGVFAQRFTAAGVPTGSEFRVNTVTSNFQSASTVAMIAAGDFVVGWGSFLQDGSGYGVYTQRYARALTVETVRPAGAAVPIKPNDNVVPEVAQLIVTMSGPAATSGLGSVISIANWQLTRGGNPVAGGITAITFGLNATTNKFEAVVNVLPLTNGTYTLTALPSILDLHSRPLDGDFDGIPGTAYSLTFEMTPKTQKGPETRVNTSTTSFYSAPAVAMDQAGNYVVVWYSSDHSNSGVFGQRYNVGGIPQGSEFQVNVFTTGSQFDPAVAMSAAGNFVVTWSSSEQDGDGLGIYARRFNAAGVALGPEFRVNSFVVGNQLVSAVAMDADGDFTVTWSSENQDGSEYGVYARRFNAAGTALGGEIAVNEFMADDQLNSAIAMHPDGNFVVTWASLFQDGSLSGVYARGFDASGTPRGPEFQVHQHTTGSQGSPAIAMDAAGGFVIVWQSDGQDGDSAGIFARRYGPTGQSLAGEFGVNDTTINGQTNPAVAIDAAGDFVMTWVSAIQDGSGNGIYAKIITPASTTGEFHVNTFTSSDQYQPKVAMDADGDLVIVWRSDNQGGSSSGIYSQRYSGNDAPIVTQLLVNGSTASQRSRVASLQVSFSTQVTFAGTVASAFTLSRNGGGAVSFAATAIVVDNVTVVTLNNFTGAEADFGSLNDGKYTLTALHTEISADGLALDGDRDGTPGDNYILVGDPTIVSRLFRLFGDSDGNGTVNAIDFVAFRGFFGLSGPSIFDFNNDGFTNATDFAQFRARFGITLTP